MSEDDRSQQLRKSLTEAGLVEIEPGEFPERIREIKEVAIDHLGELLKKQGGLHEPRLVAHALGTLSRLEATLRGEAQRRESRQATPPQPSD